MDLGDYRLLSQLGAGRDGVAYRAAAADGTAVEVRVLTVARAEPERWQHLRRRLLLAAALQHPAAQRVLGLALDRDPPQIALEWVGSRTLATELASRVPLSLLETLSLVQQLAAVLAEAHRLGAVHGRLAPTQVSLVGARDVKLDFTGLDTTPSRDPAPPPEDASCRAPECAMPEHATAPADVFALGGVLHWLWKGTAAPPVRAQAAADLAATQAGPGTAGETSAALLNALLQETRALDPADRPSAREVLDRLLRFVATAGSTRELTPLEAHGVRPTVPPLTLAEAASPRTRGPEGLHVTQVDALTGSRLGRFVLHECLGEGGMGAVYRAEDTADGSVVAIKVLRGDYARRPSAVRRFQKEARLLAEVNNPFVTNLLEVNEDRQIPYLVLEYVPGRSLDRLLAERAHLDEAQALAILADVARALVAAHARGIVHRDIKPENILLVAEGDGHASAAPGTPRVKLSDFGLARHVLESESLQMTQAGAVLGTPYYMAPEQATGGPVDPRTDIYAMGATLFHLLAGQPPFLAPTAQELLARHSQSPPPPLRKLNPAVSDGTCQVVEKCLAKAPAARYPHAEALLADLERLRRGEPTGIAVHPLLPACAPGDVVQYDWTWELEATPAQLWPYVSNTERLNRAVGLPAVAYAAEPDAAGGVRRLGRMRKLGLTAAWREHPFEWIEGRRMGVLREFSEGPFKWLVSLLELAPRPGGGTLLSHRVRLEPRGLVGRTAAAVEVGLRGRRNVERVYRRIDAALTGKLGGGLAVDPFEEPAPLPEARRQRLEQLLDRLCSRGLDPGLVERLGDFLALAPAPEVARIRPLALARRAGLDPEQVVAACLYGAREGLLVLLWDLLCPVCRLPSEVKETLRQLREHGHCEACHLDYTLDFASSVEMIFRAHPEIRDVDLGTYCMGGPAHSPHVAAQVRVAPGERLELELSLPEGTYRLRGPQLAYALDFRVDPEAPTSRWDLALARGLDPTLPRSLRAGSQTICLTNDAAHEVLVRIERTAPRGDALTAARASSMALFRELFPGEVLTPGQLVSVATVTLLVTDLDGAADLYRSRGDAAAFALIHEHFRLLEQRIRREGGALVKTVGEGVVAVFHEPVAAVRAALELPRALQEGQLTRQVQLRVGIHRGPALVATLNDHLDYFGTTVSQAARLPGLAAAGDVVLTQAVAADPQVAALLQARGLGVAVLSTGAAGGLLHRLVPDPGQGT